MGLLSIISEIRHIEESLGNLYENDLTVEERLDTLEGDVRRLEHSVDTIKYPRPMAPLKDPIIGKTTKKVKK